VSARIKVSLFTFHVINESLFFVNLEVTSIKTRMKYPLIFLSFASFILFSCGTKNQSYPDFVEKQGIETSERFLQWRGADKVLVFPIITDLHAHDRQSYKHIGYIADLDKYFRYDFMVNLGDIGLNVGEAQTSSEFADEIIRNTAAQMAKYPGVFLYTPGNHDWDAGELAQNTPQYLSSIFQRPSKKFAGDNLHLISNKCYGYYDVPDKNARIIFLDSSVATRTVRGFSYRYDDDQMKWLRNLLEQTSENMNIVLLSHYMPHPQGRWNNVPEPVTLESNNRMMALLSEYQAKRRIVGLFTGDSHVNLLEEKDGVHYFITQGLGAVSPQDMMEGQRHADFDWQESLCCDVVAIKVEKNEVRTFRIGAGGADFDYEFSY